MEELFFNYLEALAAEHEVDCFLEEGEARRYQCQPTRDLCEDVHAIRQGFIL